MKQHGLSGICIALLALVLGAAGPVRAQESQLPTVKATDAKGLLKILREAGYKAKFEENDEPSKKPLIEIAMRDGPVSVIFSDCEEAVPEFCDTLLLSASWDRSLPISDAAIADANSKFKYVSVFRDDSGDPVMQWAILTRDIGVSQPLFLDALNRYLDIVRDFSEVAFDGDEESDDAQSGAAATGVAQ